MDDLDLNLLRVFDALLRHSHVGRASGELGMSQPGFSYALRRLRMYFGDPLFVRTRGGMLPTPAAERLAPTVQHVLAQLRETLTPVHSFTPARDERVFTLALSDLGEMIVLPKLLRAFAKEAPGVDLRVWGHPLQEVPAGLAAGEVDLAIGHFLECVGADMFQQRLYSHGFTCLARKGHPRIGKHIDRETFLSLQHATIRTTGRGQQAVEQYLERHGLKRRMRLQTPHILSAVFVVAATDIVVTVPIAVGELLSSLARVQTFAPPLKLPQITVRQYWHRRGHRDPANAWLRTRVHELFSGPNGWRLHP